MTIDNISDVVNEFVKRLQLPESEYKFTVTSTNETVELIIAIGDNVKCSLNITNGNIKVLYADDYTSENYIALEFLTPVSLLYQLCILFYAAVKDVVQINFNDLLGIILLNDIYDWKTLVSALAENLDLEVEIKDDYVIVEDLEIHYSGYLNELRIGDTEIKVKGTEYTDIVEAMFKTIEYIANIMEVADNLFVVEEEPEQGPVGEEEDNVMEGGGMPSEMDVDVDMDMGDMEEEGGEEPAPVEPVENEDFSEPQEAVVTMDDLL